MSTPPLDAHYWEQRWQEADTPWDMGRVSPALRHYLDQHTTPDTRILIPGAGRAYEAVYLHQQGYTLVYVCDWADTAFGWLRQQAPDFPEAQLLVSDFFALKLEVDLVLEQTFFCAIDPALRSRYAQQVHQLLAEGGTDYLENFVSNRTRRKFKAKLVWDAKAGKVNFEFEPRAPRKTAAPKKKSA